MTTGVGILGMALLLLFLDLAKTHLEKIQLQKEIQLQEDAQFLEKLKKPARPRWTSREDGDVFVSWDEVMERTKLEKR